MSRGEMIFVTGGSGGIGAAVCRDARARGFVPIVAYRENHDAAQAIANETDGHAVRLDLADNESIDAAVAWTLTRDMPLTACVLGASPPPSIVPFGKILDDDMTLQWRINVAGHHRLLAGIIKACFRSRRAGTIVAVLSAAMGLDEGKAAPNMGAYVIAKYGLLGVLAAARGDYPWLRTAFVCPGYTETDMLKVFEERFLNLQRQQRQTGRFDDPRDVARGIVNLIETSAQ